MLSVTKYALFSQRKHVLVLEDGVVSFVFQLVSFAHACLADTKIVVVFRVYWKDFRTIFVLFCHTTVTKPSHFELKLELSFFTLKLENISK